MEHHELVARQEIGTVLAAYARYADENRPEAQVKLFTEDCRVAYSPERPLHGRGELLAALRTALADFRATSHLLGLPEITLHGEYAASAVTTVQAWHRRTSGTDMVLHGRYVDELARMDGRWLISARELQVAGAVGRAESGLAAVPRASEGDVAGSTLRAGLMQVIVAGWIDWAPEHRDIALKCFQQATEPTLAEPGCLDYTMTADPVNPERIHVFERWTDAESLREHLAAPHIKTFGEQTASLTKLGRSLHRYRVHGAEPMSSRG